MATVVTSGPTAVTTPAPSEPMVLGGCLGVGKRSARIGDVDRVHAYRADADEHLSRAGLRCVHLLVDEDFRAAVLVYAHCFHGLTVVEGQ